MDIYQNILAMHGPLKLNFFHFHYLKQEHCYCLIQLCLYIGIQLYFMNCNYSKNRAAPSKTYFNRHHFGLLFSFIFDPWCGFDILCSFAMLPERSFLWRSSAKWSRFSAARLSMNRNRRTTKCRRRKFTIFLICIRVTNCMPLCTTSN